jgi:hypothetical protein
MARIYADPEMHREYLERHRVNERRRRQYLPDRKTISRARKREEQGRIDGRRMRRGSRLVKTVVKAIAMVHSKKQDLSDKKRDL